MQTKKEIIGIFDGRVIIVKPLMMHTLKETLTCLNNQVIDLTSGIGVAKKNATRLFIDLSCFTVINSGFFGVIGSAIQEPHIETVALCGMRAAVRDIIQRLGIVPNGQQTNKPTAAVDKNLHKFRVFDSVEQGLATLIPAKGDDK